MRGKITSVFKLYQITMDTLLQKKIVFTHGVFDVPHIGHPRYLKAAKEKGEILIVGVHSDGLVRERKGEDRPIYSLEERMEFLSYYSFVDFVVELKDQEEVHYAITLLKPDILVVSSTTTDYDNKPETMKVLFSKYVKDIIVLGPQSARHSTDVIEIMSQGNNEAEEIKMIEDEESNILSKVL